MSWEITAKRCARNIKAHLIIWGTVTLELSSKAFIISPLQRMLSMHYRTNAAQVNREER